MKVINPIRPYLWREISKHEGYWTLMGQESVISRAGIL